MCLKPESCVEKERGGQKEMPSEIKEFFGRILSAEKPTHSELLLLLRAEGEAKKHLFQLADKVREKQMGKQVHLRGIIEFSNYCSQDCLYCGLRRSNRKLRRYRLAAEEILAVARQAAKTGYGTIVLQSGEDEWYGAEMLAEIIRAIKKETEMAVTLSVGERDFADYCLWREAGADRYLLKFETADEKLYEYLRPGNQLAARIEKTQWLQQLGFQTGSGNMVGIPEQTRETLAADLMLICELSPAMAGIGPFISHPETPLKNALGGTVELTLKVLALTRLLLPRAHLPATTALESLDSQGRQKALACGANVIMLNLTPLSYRDSYQIYPSKVSVAGTMEKARENMGKWLKSIGREVGEGLGHGVS